MRFVAAQLQWDRLCRWFD